MLMHHRWCNNAARAVVASSFGGAGIVIVPDLPGKGGRTEHGPTTLEVVVVVFVLY